MDLLSRRMFLAAVGTGACVALSSCVTDGGSAIMEELPEPEVGGQIPSAFLRPVPPPPMTKAPPPDAHGVLPRGAWAQEGPISSRIVPMGRITRITFHHSGDSTPFYATSYTDTARHLEMIRRYHTDPKSLGGRAWGDIAYHFAIDRTGQVWQLRSLKYQGSHVLGQNEANIGIVVLGNFELQQPTQAQKDKIIHFGSLLRSKRLYDVPTNRIYTHRELNPGHTVCPGRALQPYMVSIRQQQLI